MGKYGSLNVEVKVFESKMKPSPTGKGGVYQVIGNCHVNISMAKVMDETGKKEITPEFSLFPNFSGRISRFYKTIADFDNNTDASVIIDYSNSYKSAQGAYVPQTEPSLDLQAILEVETMKVFADGFTKSERDENNAAAAGMDMGAYTELMNRTLAAAGNVKGELETKEEKATSEKSEIEQLEADIG